MAFDRLIFSVHSRQRMTARRLNEDDVRHVLLTGETIESYPEDTPYPSYLIMGWRGNRPVHLVAADDAAARETIVITVYEPELEHWEPDFRRRKQ